MMPNTFVAALFALTVLLAPAADASAQGLSGSMGNLAVDSNAPIHIESDTLEIDEPQSLATFLGSVRAQQDDMQLTANELRIEYRGANAGASTQLRTIDAVGNVVVRVKDQIAKGARAHYDLASQTVTLSGDVVLSQGANVIRGESIIVDLTTGKANMVSASPGMGERVRGVFTPNRE